MRDLELAKDKRTISGLVVDYNQRVHSWNVMLNNNGVTRIVAYDEVGQSAYVPWFAIYVDEEVVWRINGAYVVEVSYAK